MKTHQSLGSSINNNSGSKDGGNGGCNVVVVAVVVVVVAAVVDFCRFIAPSETGKRRTLKILLQPTFHQNSHRVVRNFFFAKKNSDRTKP